MAVAVFNTDLLTFAAAGTMSTTVEFSHDDLLTTNGIRDALRDRQQGPGTITVAGHSSAKTWTVNIELPAGSRRPAVGSTDLWGWTIGGRTFRTGPLAWRWQQSDNDPPQIHVDVAFGHGSTVAPAEDCLPGWGFGLAADLDEPITGYRISRLNKVREMKTSAGRPHEFSEPQAATAIVVLDDSNGFLDPDNLDAPAPYRDNGNATLVPGRPVRIPVLPPGVDEATLIFVGIIERVRQTYPGHKDEVVVLEWRRRAETSEHRPG